MSDPPPSPLSLSKRCFGASDDEDEFLTPGQRTRSEPSRSPRGYPAHPQPPPPPTGFNPPPSKKQKLDSDFIKARFDAYERRTKQRKDIQGKVKSSSKPLGPKGGNSKPAPYAATFPPSYNQYYHGHPSAPQHSYNPDMAPPPNPRSWGVGGPSGGTQGYPNYTSPHPGCSHSMPQHSTYPPWSHSQWMPHQGYGAPPRDRYWHYTQPQQG